MTLIRNCLFALGLAAFLPTAHAQVNADAAKALAEKHLCLSCHKVGEKLVGPAFRDVAKKYQGVSEAQAKLIVKVKQGGKDRKSTRLNSSHIQKSRMPSSA